MKELEEPVAETAVPSKNELEPSAQPTDPPRPGDGDGFGLRALRTRAEIDAIERALGHTGWNRMQAARLLKISYRSLLLKIQQHKITHRTQ